MPQIFDITNWSEQPWLSTGGTRNKKIYINPYDATPYFFKQSLKKENKDYKYEFWSEIIASELGHMCGFNVLPYHLAISGNEVGCLSKSMINSEQEQLIEGGKYIQALDPTFNPEDKKLRHQYNFDLISRTLKEFQLEQYRKDIVEILVFDALIGNSDRHQENWAFITEHTSFSKSISEMEYGLENTDLSRAPVWFRWFIKPFYFARGANRIRSGYKKVKFLMAKRTKFAPIYDSGCSFGRELTDERVRGMLGLRDQIDSYVKRGESEIHWNEKKVSHFVLLENLLEDREFFGFVKGAIEMTLSGFNEASFNGVIQKVDIDLPAKCSSVKIPEERKELMCKFVLARLDLLRGLIK